MDKQKDRKVFVTNKGGHNYEKAGEYGELIYVTEGTINRFATATIYRAFVDAMAESKEDDFLLVTSMNVMNAIGAAVFARKHGRLNILLYREGKYIPRELDIDSLLYEEPDEQPAEGTQ